MRFAQRLLAFVKATVVGGVFVLAPIALLVFIMGQAFTVVYKTVHPLLQWLPTKTVGGISLVLVATIGLMVAICFLAGLVANTTLAKWLVRSIEAAVLSHMPGYTLVKTMGEGIVGVGVQNGRKAVLVQFDDHAQLGFLMDACADGRLVVFIPNVPSPWSGTLHLIEARRVQRLDVSVRQVIDKLQRLGDGTASLLPSESPPTG